MDISDLSENDVMLIKRDLQFYISPEKIYNSSLYDLMKISPGRWFDIEELASRKGIKKVCNQISVIAEIIKEVNEFEYNEKTGQIRVKEAYVFCPENVVNERTIIFYNLPNTVTEDLFMTLSKQNNLNVLLVRDINYRDISRRDLKPLFYAFNKKCEARERLIILKMETREEVFEIQAIFTAQFPDVKSCFAISNYFPDGSLSINLTEDVCRSVTERTKYLSINEAITDATLLLSKYMHYFNEYPVILDHLIKAGLMPLVYRNFSEQRMRTDMKNFLHYFESPREYIGCFSILTFKSVCEREKAICIIKNLPYPLTISLIEEKKVSNNHQFYRELSYSDQRIIRNQCFGRGSPRMRRFTDVGEKIRKDDNISQIFDSKLRQYSTAYYIVNDNFPFESVSQDDCPSTNNYHIKTSTEEEIKNHFQSQLDFLVSDFMKNSNCDIRKLLERKLVLEVKNTGELG